MAKKTPCLDCGRLCWGRRCRKHYIEWIGSLEGNSRNPMKRPGQRQRQARRMCGGANPMKRLEQRERMRGEGNPMKRLGARTRLSKAVSANHAVGVYGEEWVRKIRAALREAMNRPEVKARNREIHLGEKNSQWRGGTSGEPYTLDWPEAAKSIRERDSHTCAVCGESGRDVHHKDYDKRNNDSANLVTLCKKHHGETSAGDRDYWQAYLTGVGYELYLGAC